MKFLRSIGLAALLMVGASSASAQVYYDMTQMSGQSGYRSEIYETVTTADFLRAPANGVQRLAFTRGSAFTATVYACETKSYAAGTCTSVATLSATNPSILVTTGRAWLIVDVTAAETAGNVSYLTIRSHSTQQLSGGSAGDVFYGATGDGVTDDLPVIQAEIDRLSLLAEEKRVLRLPPGNFVIGDKNESLSEFYTGSIQLSQIDGFKLIGAGRDITNLIAGSDQGQNIITICDLNGGTDCSGVASGTTVTYDTYISDLSFVDLDPIASGGQNAVVITASAYSGGGTPTFAETVTWASGSGQFIEVGSDIGGGPRYVFSEPLVSGTIPALGETLTGSGWTAATVTASRAGAIEGTHGIGTKYSDGLVMERIGCRDLSDECIDIQYGTVNATIRDVHSTGVSSVDEGGSTVAISGANNVTVDGFYIDVGDNGIEGFASGIDIATNDTTTAGTTNITQNIYILNGSIVDTSTTTAGNGQIGVKLASQAATAELRNVNFTNVRIDKDFAGVTAVQFSGSSGMGDVTFSDSHISGRIFGPTGVTFSKSQFVGNILDGELGVVGISASNANVNYFGNTLTYPGTTVLIDLGFSALTPVKIVGNTFNSGSSLDCIVSIGEDAVISNNLFYACGTAGAAFAVQMNPGADNNVVVGNVMKDSRFANGGFYAGDGTGAGCQSDGTTKITGVFTAATAAFPVEITDASHPFADGDIVVISGLTGMAELNGRRFTVANAATNTYELLGENGTGRTPATAGTATRNPSTNVCDTNVVHDA